VLLLDWLASLGLMSATDEDAQTPTCRCSQLPDVLRFVLNQIVLKDSWSKHQAASCQSAERSLHAKPVPSPHVASM
jgi:hypothetical protein